MPKIKDEEKDMLEKLEDTQNVSTPEDGQLVPTPEEVGNADTPDEVGTTDPTEETVPEGDPNEAFDRKYVEKLRKESAGYREKAKRSEELEQQLHAALVRLDGRLADPADLPFDAGHLVDGDALAAAVTDLVNRKPGLKAQQLSGDVGAGARGSKPKPTMDLLSIMRGM